ncbi:unnamed protein product [Schistosoma margrebowiei]|uniref:Secreted protein n=1 Tax=Schistosoma margrebowiei TaxID=48269 RepID=A0A3P8FJE1_9TREM|nr:unnamed protein product [Schistosoma margrebowiei]
MKRMWSILTVAATSAFSASAGMLSGPAALPLLTDAHADLFNCWWANVDWEVHGCCFDVGWVQWSWSIQEFFEVLYPPVSLLFNVSDYLAFLAFHWSFSFAAISREFLCYVIQLSHVSFSCSLFRRRS